MGSTVEREQPATDEPDECTRLLANRIWLRHVGSAPGELARLPGERQLSRAFKATRYAIDNALNLLEDDGRLVRMPRSGSFIRRGDDPPQSSAATLQCINFIQPPSLLAEAMHWMVDDFLAGYTAALEHRHVKTRFVPCEDDCAEFESLFWPRASLQSQACLLQNRRMPSLLKWLNEQSIPFVMQNSYRYDEAGLPLHHKVYINKAGGAFMAVRHLLELGHRRIGFMGEIPSRTGAYPVYEGYRAALQCAGLTPHPDWVARIYTDDAIFDVNPILAYLRRPDRPTAIITRNDYTAISVLQAARMLSLRVPQDLSVVGVNDQAEAAKADPPLTTVVMPRRQLAAGAAELLLSVARERPETFQTRILECELAVRQSTCPPPRNG